MSIKFIGTTFPPSWLWSKYENLVIKSIHQQVDRLYATQNNLFINLTWFGPQFNNGLWQQYLQIQHQHFDNMFLLSTVDPAMVIPPQIEQMVQDLGNPKLFKLGNFDTEYHFNFFAPVLTQHFQRYENQELMLTNAKWIYINYNRKPRQHRVQFVKQLLQHKLNDYGIVTLGKPNVIYDKDPNNYLYLTIGEKAEDYAKDNHWFTGPDDFGIPHDVLTLHNMHYWQQHFLNIIGATEFNHWDDIFVSETQFKPIIGLRPFVINGNQRTYQWLRDHGFRTFNQY